MGTADGQWFRITQIDRDGILYLIRNLENMEKNRAIRTGLNAAGQVLKVEGRRRLRQRMKSGSRGVTGNLLNSFKVRVKKSKPGVLIGFRQGEKGGGSHAHLVDRGTNERFYTTKKGSRKSTGRAKANHFWSDTETMDHPKAMDKMYEAIQKAVDRINSRR